MTTKDWQRAFSTNSVCDCWRGTSVLIKTLTQS